MKQIYFDNSATTKICAEALEEYVAVSQNTYGNPSSLHGLGFEAEKIIGNASAEILSTLGAKDSEVIFTASGSEANNLAILGRAYSKERYKKGAKIITTNSEHASVNEPLNKLAAEGFKIAKIPTLGGRVDLKKLKEELTQDTILVTMMMVNNETGALYDIAAVSALMREKCRDALMHVDATQSYLKLPFTKNSLGADMITVSSHKIEGPKGVGALIVDKKINKLKALSPIILGGGQQNGYRSGTENVPGIAAFGKAAKIGFANLRAGVSANSELRNYLIYSINNSAALSEISITDPPSPAPHILNITLPKIKSETMLNFLSGEGICISAGSACSARSAGVSRALTAFGLPDSEADCSVRVSLSHLNSKEDIETFAEVLSEGVSRLAKIR